MDEKKKGFWAILELMGHRRLAGHLTEQEIAGHGFLRIDVPDGEKMLATQFYSPSAVYAITPTTEEIARRVAATAKPAPVQEWELAKALPAPEGYPDEEEDEEGDDDLEEERALLLDRVKQAEAARDKYLAALERRPADTGTAELFPSIPQAVEAGRG